MEMEGDCLSNRWATAGQPLGNRLWKWKGTILGNHWQPLMEMEGDYFG
jgi:hypothetical protein